MDYAIIRMGGKQYRVREGETLLVDRLKAGEGESFAPEVLLGGDGAAVTATIVAHERGPKIRIGKYKRRTGYRRHNGFRSSLTRIRIESLDGTRRAAPKVAPAAAVEETPVAAAETVAAETVAVGLPDGYEGMTVAQISAGAKAWDHDALEAALGYERANANRKGAVAALESALAKEG
jgi:large subunit ribosomal protein L21